jgi:anti-anti-sigma factor
MINDFSLQAELKANALLLKTNGYINNTGGEEILKEFTKHYENGVTKVLMDLAQSKVVNSIGISYLIEIIEKLNEQDGKLYFTNLDPAIEKTFTIMGIFQFAEKVDSLDDVISE